MRADVEVAHDALAGRSRAGERERGGRLGQGLAQRGGIGRAGDRAPGTEHRLVAPVGDQAGEIVGQPVGVGLEEQDHRVAVASGHARTAAAEPGVRDVARVVGRCDDGQRPAGREAERAQARSERGAAEVAAPGEVDELAGQHAAPVLLCARLRILEHEVGGHLLDHQPRVVTDVAERRADQHRRAGRQERCGAERAGALADRRRQLPAARGTRGLAGDLGVRHRVAAVRRAAARPDEPDREPGLLAQEVEQRGVAAAGAEPLQQPPRTRELQAQPGRVAAVGSDRGDHRERQVLRHLEQRQPELLTGGEQVGRHLGVVVGEPEPDSHGPGRRDLGRPRGAVNVLGPQPVGEHELAREQVARRLVEVRRVRAGDRAVGRCGTREQPQPE